MVHGSSSCLLDLERRLASRKKSILDNTSPMIWKTLSGTLIVLFFSFQCVVEINVIFLVTYLPWKLWHYSHDYESDTFFFSHVKSLERKSSPGIEGLNLSSFDRPMAPTTEIRELRWESQPISRFHSFILRQIQIQIFCFFLFQGVSSYVECRWKNTKQRS